MTQVHYVKDAVAARRRRLIDTDGSPNFLHTFSTISASGSESVVLQQDFPASRRYEPLTSCLLTNNSAADLDLHINGRPFGFIPAGVITSITDQAIWSIKLVNNDSVAASNPLVRANFSSPPMGADMAARRAV